SGRNAPRTLARCIPALTRARQHISNAALEWVARNKTRLSLRPATQHDAHTDDRLHRERPTVDRRGEESGGARALPLARRLLRDDSRRATGPSSARSGPRWLRLLHNPGRS